MGSFFFGIIPAAVAVVGCLVEIEPPRPAWSQAERVEPADTLPLPAVRGMKKPPVWVRGRGGQADGSAPVMLAA